MLITGLPTVEIRYVSDGFALVDAKEASPADVVLIGRHNGNDVGTNAQISRSPCFRAARAIVIGTMADMCLPAGDRYHCNRSSFPREHIQAQAPRSHPSTALRAPINADSVEGRRPYGQSPFLLSPVRIG